MSAGSEKVETEQQKEGKEKKIENEESEQGRERDIGRSGCEVRRWKNGCRKHKKIKGGRDNIECGGMGQERRRIMLQIIFFQKVYSKHLPCVVCYL